MGEIARTVAAGLGQESVIGVIPSHLQSREVSWAQLDMYAFSTSTLTDQAFLAARRL